LRQAFVNSLRYRACATTPVFVTRKPVSLMAARKASPSREPWVLKNLLTRGSGSKPANLPHVTTRSLASSVGEDDWVGEIERADAGRSLCREHRSSAAVEPHEAEDVRKLRMLLPQLCEQAKRLPCVGDLRQHAPVTVVNEEEAFHRITVPAAGC